MSDQTFTGFVVKLSKNTGTTRNGKDWFAYSARLADKDGNEFPYWFQFGFNKTPKDGKTGANVAENDYVRVSGEKKDDKAITVDLDSVRISKNPPQRKQAESSGGGNKGGKGGGGYNSPEQQAYRSYHAARGSAIDLVSVLLEHNGLPVAATQGKAGKAKRYLEVIDFVNKLTVQFFRDGHAEGFEDQFRLLEMVADSGIEEVPNVGDLPESDDDGPEFDDDTPDFDDVPGDGDSDAEFDD